MNKELFFWQLLIGFVIVALSTIGFLLGFWSTEVSENVDIFVVGWIVGSGIIMLFKKKGPWINDKRK